MSSLDRHMPLSNFVVQVSGSALWETRSKRPTNTIEKSTQEVVMGEDKKTLCGHVEDELHVKDPQAYIKLIHPATHFCQNCGRGAAKAENVCNPKEIK